MKTVSRSLSPPALSRTVALAQIQSQSVSEKWATASRGSVDRVNLAPNESKFSVLSRTKWWNILLKVVYFHCKMNLVTLLIFTTHLSVYFVTASECMDTAKLNTTEHTVISSHINSIS